MSRLKQAESVWKSQMDTTEAAKEWHSSLRTKPKELYLSVPSEFQILTTLWLQPAIKN